MPSQSGDHDAYHAPGLTNAAGEYQRDTVNTPVGVRCLKKDAESLNRIEAVLGK